MNNIIALFLIAFSIFLSVWYTKPMMDDVSMLRTENASLNASLGEIKDLSNVMAEKENTYNSFTDDEKAKVNKLLPDSIDNVKLIIDIDDIAQKYRMKIRNIDLKAENAGAEGEEAVQSYGTAMLRFSVTAPYDRFKLFMADLEDSLRLVDVSSLSFDASDKDQNEFNVELKTYWLKESI